MNSILPLNEMIDCLGCLTESERCVTHSFDHNNIRIIAHDLVNESLKDLPTRKSHSEAVGKRMEFLCGNAAPFIRSYCYAIGLIHDIGYGHVSTGHHAIDGAIYLETTALSDLSPYVAWHSTAKYEAEARGIKINFNKPLSKHINDQLWYADFTTSPTGESTTVKNRLDEILTRYSPDSQVIQALNNSTPEMRVAFKEFGETL